MSTTALEALATGGATLAVASVPHEVVHHAKRAVVDWVAALMPGSVAAPAQAMQRAMTDDLDHGRSRLALGRATTARAAALINGTAAHTVEVDDIYREAIYHPGAPTIAASLATAQDLGRGGEAFLRGVIVGYEIGTRIGATLGRAHYRYWHNTGTVGTFGAAAAAGALMSLEAPRLAHAFATAATFAAGLQQAFRMDSMSKPLHAGRAAEGGLLAAQLAAQGVTGSLDVLDGEAGLGRAMADGPDWTSIGATLGQDFHITRMTFKNHACCGHAFAAIDGALALKHRLQVDADDIAHIRVATYGPAIEVAGNPDPKTPAQARFSLQYVVSSALVHGSVRLAAATPARIFDPATRALMSRLELCVDPELDAAFPGRRAARVTMTTRDGRVETFLQPTRKGDPDLPLSDAELDEKFLELVSPVLGEARARACLRRLWELETLPEVGSLFG